MENSPLDGLPPEVRNRIYQATLLEQRPVAISPNFWTEPPLTRACRQIRQECLSMFYSVNDFTAVVKGLNVDTPLARWLQQVHRENSKLIKSLHIRIECPGKNYETIMDAEAADPALSMKGHAGFLKCIAGCDFGERRLVSVLRLSLNSTEDSYDIGTAITASSATQMWQVLLPKVLMLNLAYPIEFQEEVEGMGAIMKVLEFDQKMQEQRARSGRPKGVEVA